jgi:dienelactone hydrolase
VVAPDGVIAHRLAATVSKERTLTRRHILACLLGLALFFPAPHARAVTPDREAAYRGALPLYQDDAKAPLAAVVQSVSPFGAGRLIRFSYAGADGERVPALLYLPPGAGRAHPVPCLVALHGLGGAKETMAGFALAALGWGDATLAIDEYGQGERPRVATPQGRLGLDALTVGIEHTAVDVRRGLDYLDTRPDIAHSRIGLVGVSLGAIIGTVTAGVEPRLRAVVLISGGGDWGLILHSLADENADIAGRPMATLRGTDWDGVRAALAPVDPLTFAPQIAPRPVLMLHGRRDWIIVPAAAQALYAAADGPPDAHAQIVWFPQAGHIPPPELMYPDIHAFLKKSL